MYLIWRGLHKKPLTQKKVPQREPDFASLLREGDREAVEGVTFLTRRRTPSVAYGDSSLRREPYFASLLREGDREAVEGVTFLARRRTPSVAFGDSSLGEGAYIKFKMILAEKTPSSAVKSYIPSYLLVVEITERMPTP